MILTKQTTLPTVAPLSVTIDGLIFEHGAWRFIFAAMIGLMRAPVLRREVETMPNHLRRDIGLPPKVEPLRPWEPMR